MNNFFKLLFSISIPALIIFINSFLILGSSDWYLALHKPPFNPPSWMFISAWAISYLFIGLFFYCAWKKKDLKELQTELFVYLTQLGLSLLWFIIFFGLRNPNLAFIEMFFLLISVAIFSLKFYRINGRLDYLLAPYIFWISFVAVLNFSIVILN